MCFRPVPWCKAPKCAEGRAGCLESVTLNMLLPSSAQADVMLLRSDDGEGFGFRVFGV